LAAPGRHRKPISGQREREEIENSAYTDYGKDLPGAADQPANEHSNHLPRLEQQIRLPSSPPSNLQAPGAGQNEQTRERALNEPAIQGISFVRRIRGKIVISRGYVWERKLKWIPNSKMARKTRLQSFYWQIGEAIVDGGKSAKPNV